MSKERSLTFSVSSARLSAAKLEETVELNSDLSPIMTTIMDVEMENAFFCGFIYRWCPQLAMVQGR
jgi:hypothetical protein